ncbi:MAG: hypothetical protein JSC085_000710 [Candidatus Tokpelaia sp. JSC085]|nr:MAG: hypothetical protein JSC085_000710 [Candidatus Tokpelaia sp. JSC085]
MGVLHYFRLAFLYTGIALLLEGWLGWIYTRTLVGLGHFIFICFILILLEISLSFDNSIINARVLCNMTQQWQKRFFTWGMIVAVFGVRMIFPLVIVTIAAHINPVSAFQLAIWQPEEYTAIIMDAHVGIAAFGGTFLMMMGLKYFFNPEKDVHWIHCLETRAKRCGSMRGIEIAITLLLILIFSSLIDDADKHIFLLAAIYALLVFLLIEASSTFCNITQEQVYRSGIGAFISLEMLDASFSFDGVIGAFALSKNFLTIAIGLGVGALYVRSMTMMLVENKILNRYRYLEHGAFYAILMLAFSMYIQTLIHIPEVIIGLSSIYFIITAFYSSIRYKNRDLA